MYKKCEVPITQLKKNADLSKIPFKTTNFNVSNWQEIDLSFTLKNDEILNIFRIQKKHIKKIVNIENSVFSEPWAESAFDAEINSPQNNLNFIGIIEKEIAAYIVSQIVVDELHIGTFAVVPDFEIEMTKVSGILFLVKVSRRPVGSVESIVYSNLSVWWERES